MSDSITLPDCPECTNDMDMPLGNTEFTSDGVVHIFDCEHCGNRERWSSSELREKGVGRPSLRQFIDYYDITADELLQFFNPMQLLKFAQEKANNPQALESEESLTERVAKAGISLKDISEYFGDGTIEDFSDHLSEKRDN